jgi:hypothetical protein
MKYVLLATLLGTVVGLVAGLIRIERPLQSIEQGVAAHDYGLILWECFVSAGAWGIGFAFTSFACFVLIVL